MGTTRLLRFCLLMTVVAISTQLAAGSAAPLAGNSSPSPPGQTHVHSTELPAQQQSFYERMHRLHPAAPVPTSMLAIAIDGAVTPEAIPDDLAYRHFILAIAQRTKASKEDIARRNAMLRVVELPTEDREVLIGALANVRDELDKIALERRQFPREFVLNPTTLAAKALLKRREDEIFDKARTRILLTLTWQGQTRLDEHVRNHVKRRIVVYGDQPVR